MSCHTRPSPRVVSRPLAGGSFSWAVGINAAPRPEPVLDDCVKSLKECGWEPLVQAEPGTRIPQGVKHVINQKRLGNFHNFRPADRSRPLKEQVFSACQEPPGTNPNSP